MTFSQMSLFDSDGVQDSEKPMISSEIEGSTPANASAELYDGVPIGEPHHADYGEEFEPPYESDYQNYSDPSQDFIPNFGDEMPSDLSDRRGDNTDLLEGLNAQQAEAVRYEGPALLIGAGAGSGKTRVLTRRIAWALQQWHAYPSQILAITFTNKAAAEMKERLQSLIGDDVKNMWVSTFHSACVRILRYHGEPVGLKSSFSIYDQSDCERLIKLIAADLNIDVKRYTPRAIMSAISDFKNSLTSVQVALQQVDSHYVAGKRGQQIINASNSQEVYATCYAEYDYRLRAANSVDFDDLLMRTVELLRTSREALEHYRKRFSYIFVDEYQDTNHAQYILIRLLCGIENPFSSDETRSQKTGSAWVTVVGDSDQSIYAFRGADISNILDFERDFPQARTIMLEQNYRSTQTILDAANAVISHNTQRTPKKLWTALGQGSLIVGYAADNAQQEAQWISQKINETCDFGDFLYSDISVMYRANAQSRPIEEAFIHAGIPYQLIGGTRFYERREIKDAMAYVRAVANPDDDVNTRRILNVPKRGLGARAEALLTDDAAQRGSSLWMAIEFCDANDSLPSRTKNSVQEFRDIMRHLRQFATEHDSKPSEIIAEVLEKSGLLAELKASDDPQDAMRVENLGQLQAVAVEYEQKAEEPSLNDFLETTALVADSDALNTDNAGGGSVTLMTLHTAKGLEYPVVFLPGMEQGTFPHSRSIEDERELSEERRLAYVGITRAQRKLFVSRSGVRAQWGQAQDMFPSQFLDEIPAELMQWERQETTVERLRSGWDSEGSHRRGNDDDYDFDEFGGFDDDDYFDTPSFGGRSYGSSYGSSHGGRSSSGSSYRSTYGSSSETSYGSRSSSYGSGGSSRSSSDRGTYRTSHFTASDGSGNSYGSFNRGSRGYGSSRSGAVKSRKITSSSSAKTPTSSSNMTTYSVSDFALGDKITHDQYGLGTVNGIEDKGANSIISVDFGTQGVKRLMLRVAPIEKL